MNLRWIFLVVAAAGVTAILCRTGIENPQALPPVTAEARGGQPPAPKSAAVETPAAPVEPSAETVPSEPVRAEKVLPPVGVEAAPLVITDDQVRPALAIPQQTLPLPAATSEQAGEIKVPQITPVKAVAGGNDDTPARTTKTDAAATSIDGAVLESAGQPSNADERDISAKPIEDESGNASPPSKIVPANNGAGTGEVGPARDIGGQPGRNLAFLESPPKTVDGVNPGDRVETRVVRLHYFRDAHRVAQIVNRDVQSNNDQAVETQRRLAGNTRAAAIQLTDERRAHERSAVEAARLTREAEASLKQAQDALAQARHNANRIFGVNQTLEPILASAQREAAQAAASQTAWEQELTNRFAESPRNDELLAKALATLQQATLAAREANARLQRLQQQQKTAQANLAAETGNVNTAQARVQTALADVQTKRNAEGVANDLTRNAIAKEACSREEQLRRESAAGHADPVTYGPADIKSPDPVQQCSISVIGEGLLQLRGPIKGVNVMRTMINQIDAPVGQVRVAFHTAQVHGEHMDRMEKAAGGIQKYIDHARFLTSQSGQMLRKAVVLVARRKTEAYATAPTDSQATRDPKYLHGFFGQDFIQELRPLDSEFLKAGNKLLGLHSMDSSSLSSALFLLALASNSTRHEILDEFARLTANDLPAAELKYLATAGTGNDGRKLPPLAGNARFQSLRGFFNTEFHGDETMTPIQREFVRLAQTFKNQVISELELKQRVLERTILEERSGQSFDEQIKATRQREADAITASANTQHSLKNARAVTVQTLIQVLAEVSDKKAVEKTPEPAAEIRRRAERMLKEISRDPVDIIEMYKQWVSVRNLVTEQVPGAWAARASKLFPDVERAFAALLPLHQQSQSARKAAADSRRQIDHKKVLDMLIDEIEEKSIELLEGTRAHTANVDNYVKSISAALDDDFQTQFCRPAFRGVRESGKLWDVTCGEFETISLLANHRGFAKVTPRATLEFDLQKRGPAAAEAANAARSNPSLTLQALSPDPALHKLETGTGFEIRPVIGPDGQTVVFRFRYVCSTNVRDSVRADEKHPGRVKQHFIDTDVQLRNHELREISRYVVALKASRAGRGVPLLQDIPGVGVMFRPPPSAEASLQQNIILGQATIYPTLFDLMGLRWAPSILVLDPPRPTNQEITTRLRLQDLKDRTYAFTSSRVDELLRVPAAERHTDSNRSQEMLPVVQPAGYYGPGPNPRDSQLREGAPIRPVPPGTLPKGGVIEQPRVRPAAPSAVTPKHPEPPSAGQPAGSARMAPTEPLAPEPQPVSSSRPVTSSGESSLKSQGVPAAPLTALPALMPPAPAPLAPPLVPAPLTLTPPPPLVPAPILAPPVPAWNTSRPATAGEAAPMRPVPPFPGHGGASQPPAPPPSPNPPLIWSIPVNHVPVYSQPISGPVLVPATPNSGR